VGSPEGHKEDPRGGQPQIGTTTPGLYRGCRPSEVTQAFPRRASSPFPQSITASAPIRRLYNGRMADSLGNAFHRLRAYAHPHAKHVITQTLEQGDGADFVGSEQNVHIHRQAMKIQRGDSFTTEG
jgi:hypothetical protein